MRSKVWWTARVVGAMAVGLVFGLGVGCKEPAGSGTAQPEKRGAPPPPPPAAASSGAAAASCSRASASDDVAKAFLAARAEGFCLDPKEADKSFGKGTALALEKIADLFDGESKNYEDYGVDRVVHVHYVAEVGGPSSIDVNASRFATPAGAYAMFTKRVVGDGDPADEATPKEAPGVDGGALVLGVGNAYVWRGAWLLEIVYNDDTATPDKLDNDGKRVLAAFAKTLGQKLPAGPAAPAEVAALPVEGRLPMGVRYRLASPFPGLPGDADHPAAGSVAGAVGYYRDGTKRYRVSVVAASDEAAAKEVFKVAAKTAGATPVLGAGDEATRYTWKEGALAGSVTVARKGTRIVAVWDELRVLKAGLSDEDRHMLSLSDDERDKRARDIVSSQ